MLSREEAIEFKNLAKKIEGKLKKKPYKCLHENCEKIAVSSHALQKRGPIKHVAKNGDVVALKQSRHHDFSIDKKEVKLKFGTVGVKKISTYPGFCQEHDDRLFSDIEKRGLDLRNPKHLCLLFYRNFSYEFSRKRELYLYWMNFIDSKKLPIPPFAYRSTESARRYCEVTCEYNLAAARKMIKEESYSNLSSQYFVINKNVNAACASVLNLHLDNYIDFAMANPGKPIPSFSLSLLPEQNKTNFILSWLKEYDEHAFWITNAFKSEKTIELILNRLCFCDSEDVVLSPDLWDSIIDKDKFMHNMGHVAVRGQLGVEDIPIFLKLQ